MNSSTLPSTSLLDGVSGHRHATSVLHPRKDPIPIVQDTGLAPGPAWTGVENLTPTGIRSSDSPAGSDSLYRQR